MKFEWNPDDMDCEHTIGDVQCAGCYQIPKKCTYCEGGIVHNEFMEYYTEYGLCLYRKCDKCGEIG